MFKKLKLFGFLTLLFFSIASRCASEEEQHVVHSKFPTFNPIKITGMYLQRAKKVLSIKNFLILIYLYGKFTTICFFVSQCLMFASFFGIILSRITLSDRIDALSLKLFDLSDTVTIPCKIPFYPIFFALNRMASITDNGKRLSPLYWYNLPERRRIAHIIHDLLNEHNQTMDMKKLKSLCRRYKENDRNVLLFAQGYYREYDHLTYKQIFERALQIQDKKPLFYICKTLKQTDKSKKISKLSRFITHFAFQELETPEKKATIRAICKSNVFENDKDFIDDFIGYSLERCRIDQCIIDYIEYDKSGFYRYNFAKYVPVVLAYGCKDTIPKSTVLKVLYKRSISPLSTFRIIEKILSRHPIEKLNLKELIDYKKAKGSTKSIDLISMIKLLLSYAALEINFNFNVSEIIEHAKIIKEMLQDEQTFKDHFFNYDDFKQKDHSTLCKTMLERYPQSTAHWILRNLQAQLTSLKKEKFIDSTTTDTDYISTLCLDQMNTILGQPDTDEETKKRITPWKDLMLFLHAKVVGVFQEKQEKLATLILHIVEQGYFEKPKTYKALRPILKSLLGDISLCPDITIQNGTEESLLHLLTRRSFDNNMLKRIINTYKIRNPFMLTVALSCMVEHTNFKEDATTTLQNMIEKRLQDYENALHEIEKEMILANETKGILQNIK